jgi:hypothetical protein
MFEDEFRKLYTQLGFIAENGNHLPLFEVCNHAERCWNRVGDERRPLQNESGISAPWVGRKYNELGLLVIGINTNDAGGEGALTNLVERAREKLLDDPLRRLVFADRQHGYRGSLFYHRAGSCAFEFAKSAKLLEEPSEMSPDGFPCNGDIAHAYDYVTYTNHIKCTLRGDRGRPTHQMWEMCGGHVLAREVSILQPRYILILGMADNWWYFYQKVLNGRALPPAQGNGEVRQDEVEMYGKAVRILLVPHPIRMGPNVFTIIRQATHELVTQT